MPSGGKVNKKNFLTLKKKGGRLFIRLFALFFAESVRKVIGVIKVTIQTNLLFDKSARQNHSKNTANSGGVFMLFGSSVCELCVTQKTNFKKTSHKYLFFNVIRAGFEPTTHSLEGLKIHVFLLFRTFHLYIYIPYFQ